MKTSALSLLVALWRWTPRMQTSAYSSGRLMSWGGGKVPIDEPAGLIAPPRTPGVGGPRQRTCTPPHANPLG